MALVENLQREDLNAIDEAEAFSQLKGDFNLSQEEVAKRVGKSRVAVANSVRLLNLPAAIQEDVRDGEISAGHARALLGIPDKAKQRVIWIAYIPFLRKLCLDLTLYHGIILLGDTLSTVVPRKRC